MKSIDNRLSAVEKNAAKAEHIIATYRDGAEVEMDLLQAIRLLLGGTVRIITRPWKVGEQKEYQSDVLCELEEIMESARQKYIIEKTEE